MADESRAQRAEARERRRSLTSQPFEEMDEAADHDGQSAPLAAAKRAAGTAAAAALAGALAGAAKAYSDRRARGKEQDEPEAEQHASDEPQAERDDATDEAEPQADDEPHAEAEPEPVEDEQQATNEEDRPDDDENGAHGASPGDASQIVKQARAQLKDLLGIEAESISGLQRSNGSWHVMLEAVELHRIPDSQDVLSSYEVVLDDDGGIVSMERTRRYRRAQVEAD
jgi:Gas vesicle synthesis protein GvpO